MNYPIKTSNRVVTGAALALHELGDLTIIMDPNYGWTHYIGTRLQLEAEGIIPGKSHWPDGWDSSDWEAHGIHFTLKRQRPEGAKGPRRDFVDCDNWRLSMSKVGISYLDIQIMLKAKELRDMVYRQTREWSENWNKRWKLYSHAQADEKFQAFKALIPALILAPDKRRGRPPKTAIQSQEG